MVPDLGLEGLPNPPLLEFIAVTEFHEELREEEPKLATPPNAYLLRLTSVTQLDGGSTTSALTKIR